MLSVISIRLWPSRSCTTLMGTPACTRWFACQRHVLCHGIPQAVFHALQQLARMARRRKALTAVATVQDSLSYLEKRQDMLAYAWCEAQGYPMGSGSVESTNKLVVERRLKGAGMHWARAHVHPMVALRAMACSDRWAEAWPQIAQHVRHQTQQDRRQRQLARRQVKAAMPFGYPAARSACGPHHGSDGATKACPAVVPIAQVCRAPGRESSPSPTLRPPVAALSPQLEESLTDPNRDLRKTLTHTPHTLPPLHWIIPVL
jgi:hypothetical protein